MADDLGDDWWNEDTVKENDEDDSSASADIENQKATDKPTGDLSSRKGMKRPHQEVNKKITGSENKVDVQQDEGEQPKKKKKKRRKKKKMGTHIAETKKPATATDLRESLHNFYQGRLSAIEMQDIQLSDESFLSSNTEDKPLSDYLKSCLPKWNNLIKKHKPVPPQTCLLILVTGAARRAVELNRQAADFKGECTSAKLFAKHLKIADQVRMLNKAGAHFAVGTPNRVSSLIQSDALKLEETFYLIIDWNWRDVKLRRLVDVPETRKDLSELLRKYLIPAIKTGGKAKIGLF